MIEDAHAAWRPTQAMIEEARRARELGHPTLTAELMGDPLPGRSALDHLRQAEMRDGKVRELWPGIRANEAEPKAPELFARVRSRPEQERGRKTAPRHRYAGQA